MQQDIIQLFGKHGSFQRRRLRDRLFQNTSNSLIALQNLLCLYFGMIKCVFYFNVFYPILHLIIQSEMFMIDQVVNGFVITEIRKKFLYFSNSGGRKGPVVDK